MNHLLVVRFALIGAMICCSVGCAASTRGPYTPVSEGVRNEAMARRMNARAVDLLEKDPAEAERLLREALAADLFFGPAHNNLGVLFLRRGELYEAASEFEWARKLMPGHPDPRMNLALTLEMAGRTDDALSTYATAIEVYPGHLPSIQAMTRLQVRSSRTDEHTAERLREIAFRGESDAWKQWARAELAKGRH